MLNNDQVSQTDANANRVELENPATANSGVLEPATCTTTDVYPTGLEPATPVLKLPIHDVYIGGARPTSTEEDLRAFVVKIGVISNSNQSISCISGDGPHSSSLRVIIRIYSIKNTIYNSTNFKASITVKPFRFYVKKNNKIIASSERNTMIQKTDNYTDRRNHRNNHNRERSATCDANRSSITIETITTEIDLHLGMTHIAIFNNAGITIDHVLMSITVIDTEGATSVQHVNNKETYVLFLLYPVLIKLVIHPEPMMKHGIEIRCTHTITMIIRHIITVIVLNPI